MNDRPAKRRSAFFGQQVVRLMTKTCVANELGPTAFTLLAVVSAQQDAAGGRAVNFFNEQLMPLVGIRKWDTLDAVRKACVKAGWLKYDPPPAGSRRTPGLYSVQIPEKHAHVTDSRCDEGSPQPYPQNGDGHDKAYPFNGEGHGDGRGYGHGDSHGEPPSSPSSSPSISCRSEAATHAKAKPVKAEYPSDFEEFWNAYPKRDGRRNGKVKSLRLWRQVPADDRPLVLKAAINFSGSRLALDNKARDPERFLAAEWWREWIETERPSANGHQLRVVQPAQIPPEPSARVQKAGAF